MVSEGQERVCFLFFQNVIQIKPGVISKPLNKNTPMETLERFLKNPNSGERICPKNKSQIKKQKVRVTFWLLSNLHEKHMASYGTKEM